jgi:hypothetical protein
MVVAAAVSVMGLLGTTTAPAGASGKPLHFTWNGYRGVGIGTRIHAAGRTWHSPVRNACGQYKDVLTYHHEMFASSQFGPNLNQVTLVGVSSVNYTSNHAAAGPHGVALASTVNAAKAAWGGKLHVYRNEDGGTYRWGRGPGSKILIIGAGFMVIDGTDYDHRVWIVMVAENHKIAVDEMNNEGGC